MRNGLKGVNGAARRESPKAPRTKEAARHCGQKPPGTAGKRQADGIRMSSATALDDKPGSARQPP